MNGKILAAALCAVATLSAAWPKQSGRPRPTESGGVLSAEQASYDVKAYDLTLRVDPQQRAIEGTLTLEATVVQPMRWLVLDLDTPLTVRSVTWLERESRALRFQRSPTRIRIEFPQTRQPGDTIKVAVAYGGKPREAPRPPWVGGFVWARTAAGQPWVAVACQLDGADLWWPVKDHPSDEPDRMGLHITVPAGLTVASNGTLDRVADLPDGWRRFDWTVHNPINVYDVTVNIAPYREFKDTYKSVSGETVPVYFWVLPEHYEKAKELFHQIPKHLRFLEKTIGPYPFRSEKYGLAEAPYLGMEHQTVIAYGNDFHNNSFGFDALHFHELAHEWWGNMLSVADWRDYWIHEGFASYMEALYAESLAGANGLEDSMLAMRSRIRNRDPLAPRESRTTVAKYFAAPDYTQADGDVNPKGAWVLHTLRWLIGDDAFHESLRRFAYPLPTEASAKAGCRFVSSEDFVNTVETVTGRELGWFFEVYLRQPRLPVLHARREGDELDLRWEVPASLPFPMPVEVRLGNQTLRLDVPADGARLPLRGNPKITIDPHHWILRENAEP